MKVPGILHFQLEELVDQPIFVAYGENAIWQLDRGLVVDVDALRAFVGPIVINNWHLDGPYHESGRRTLQTLTGSPYSQHKRGCAFDLKPQKVSVMELYEHIITHKQLYPYIRAIENPQSTKTWLHVDSRWHTSPDILIVEPTT